MANENIAYVTEYLHHSFRGWLWIARRHVWKLNMVMYVISERRTLVCDEVFICISAQAVVQSPLSQIGCVEGQALQAVPVMYITLRCTLPAGA
jgi:hypothetical protein